MSPTPRLPSRPGRTPWWGARARGPAVALALLLCAPPGARVAQAAPPPEAEIAAAEAEQNRQLTEARRGGSLASVVRSYESRLGRQNSALNQYLLGRALFHAQDRPGALRAMLEVVQREPDFWQAHVRIGSLYWIEKNPAAARQHLDLARRRAADAPDVLRLAAEVGYGTKDYDLALSALTSLSRLEPDDVSLRAALADVLAAKGDWEGAYRELRVLRLRDAKNPVVRLRYLEAAFRTRRYPEAAAEGEDLTRVKGEVADVRVLRQALDLLRQTYVETKRWKELAGVLERLTPWVKEEHRAGLAETIAALKAGQVPGEGSAPAAPPTEEDALLGLLGRATGPDVVKRRAALQEFFALGAGWVPSAILMRFHPAEDADPECRAWVVRIVAALANEKVAKVAGHALQDPAPLVRRVAAGALGEIGTPAGLVYLLAYLDELPLAADASDDVVQEYNAARGALVSLTGYDDVEIGGERWIPAAGLVASRERWRAWLATPPGVERKLRAITDLEATGETHPEWYLIVLVFVDPSLEVVRAAYGALLARSRQLTDDPRGQALWPRFPRADPGTLTAEGLTPLRQQLKSWWTEWVSQRPAAGK